MMKALKPLLAASAIALAALLTVSCRPSDPPAYSQFEQIRGSGWSPVDVLVFQPWPADSAEASSSAYRMDLVMRFSARSEPAKLPLAICIEDESGVLRRDTLMIDPSTLPGTSNYGVRESVMTLEENVRLTDGYTVSMSPLTPEEHSRGMLNVGVLLHKVR